MAPKNVISQYGLSEKSLVSVLGTGLINSTWRIDVPNDASFVLQKINTNVFKDPNAIAANLDLLSDHIKNSQPDYLFMAPLKTISGQSLVENHNSFYRLFPFANNSVTFTTVPSPAHAYEAARQFGMFNRVFSSFEASRLKQTIPDFHNLSIRFQQFTTAVKNNAANRASECRDDINYLLANSPIVDTYNHIIRSGQVKQRVTHHDTKISNVLFDDQGKGICVIDLDTTMSGMYISDVGDMFRTYLCEASEEEKDYTLIEVRPEFFQAIADGYLEQMNSCLSEDEKSLLIYSGNFLIYMQALRFLADYLNGDIYYSTHYPGQNLVRTRNQIQLLKSFQARETEFRAYLKSRKTA